MGDDCKYYEQCFKDYCIVLQSIADMQYDADMLGTAYGLESRREEAHEKVMDFVMGSLNPEADYNEVYLRTKDIMSRLDKVWKIYDDTPFDILSKEFIVWMPHYLTRLFASTECKYYLEGKIDGLRNVVNF